MDEKKPTQSPETDQKTEIKPEEVIDKPASSLQQKTSTKKLFFIVVIVFFVALVGVFLITLFKNNPKKNFQDKANSEFIQNKFQESAKTAKEGLDKYPTDPYLLKTILNSNSSFGNANGKEKEAFEKNAPYITVADKVAQKDVELLLALGYAYETSGSYEKALEYYEKAYALNPKSGSINFHKGHVLLFMNKHSDGKSFIEKATQLEPDNPYFKVALGNILLEEGKTQDALNLFIAAGEDAKMSNSYRSEALTSAGFIYSFNDQLAESLNLTQRAIELDPSNSKANALYGFNYVLLNKPDQGIKYISKAIELNPRIVLNYMMRGIYLRMVGFNKEALKEQLYGIENINNDNTLVGDNSKNHTLAFMQFELAETYSRLNDSSNAIKSLQSAFKNNPLIKESIEKSIKNNYFSNIKSSSQFIALTK